VASEWLFERIRLRGSVPLPPRQHILTAQLVVGQSCAPPPA